MSDTAIGAAPSYQQPSDYWTRFRGRCAEWGEKHPSEYTQMLDEARQACHVAGEANELRPAKQRVVEAIVNERIRLLAGWPDEATFLKRQEAGLDPSTGAPR